MNRQRSKGSVSSALKKNLLKPGTCDTPGIGRSGIPKYKQLESLQKNQRTSGKFNRTSFEKIGRVSLASGRTTPSKFVTPIQNKLLPPSVAVSRCSTDTLRSSFGGGSKARTNVWPLNEPSFKTQCIDKVLEFLHQKKYEHTFNRAMLRTPAAKDFSLMFTFIYKHIDNSYRPVPRFEDEIPKILKMMKYPIQMPKSSFLNVGSPHTWPSVLAMLTWLIDIIICYDEFNCQDIAFPKDFSDEADFTEKKFQYFIDTYNTENEEERENYVLEYGEELKRISSLSPNEFEVMKAEESQLAASLENMSCVKEQINILKQQHYHLIQDKEKILKFNEDMKNHIAINDRERASIQAQLEEVRDQVAQTQEEIDQLKSIKDQQTFSNAELKRFKNHALEVANSINYLQMAEKHLKEQIWAMEIEIGQKLKIVSQLTFKNNTLCRNHNFESCEISALILKDHIQEWENVYLPFLRSEKRKARERTFEAQNLITTKKDENEKVEELVKDKQKECSKMKCKAARLEDEIQCIKEEMNAEGQQLQKEFERLNQDMSEAKKLSKVSLYEKENKLKEVKKNFELWENKIIQKKTKGEEFIAQTTEVIKTYLDQRKLTNQKHQVAMNQLVVEHMLKCKDILQEENL